MKNTNLTRAAASLLACGMVFGLTEAELAERDALRQEYLADIRASMIDQLEHTTVIEPDGTRRKLQVRH